MTDSPQAKLPRPDELDLVFYRAVAKAGALRIQRCDACGTWTHPARYYCPKCASADFSFAPPSGRATVYSYTVSHMSVDPVWKDRVPYVTIVAELEEGPRLVTGTKGIGPRDVAIGMPVRIEVDVKSDEFALFRAERAEGAPHE